MYITLREIFQREWKQSTNFFIHTKLEVEEEENDLEGSIDLEEAPEERPQIKEVPTEGGN